MEVSIPSWLSIGTDRLHLETRGSRGRVHSLRGFEVGGADFAPSILECSFTLPMNRVRPIRILIAKIFS